MRFPKLREHLEELSEHSRLAKRDKQRALAELECLEGLKDFHDNMWEICANFEMRWGLLGQSGVSSAKRRHLVLNEKRKKLSGTVMGETRKRPRWFPS